MNDRLARADDRAGPIKKVCVIGAGTMGAGIAAQVANAGVPVILLDVVRDLNDRDAVARGAVARLLKTDPAPFMSVAAAKLVEIGNIEDHLADVAGCDWIVEAIVERLDVKQDLYARLEAVRRPGTAMSSNTSTIPLEQLVAGRSEDFTRDFLITHFFNPPRHMRLVELVSGPKSDPGLVARMEDFIDRSLGKVIVRAKDSPGFIANRLGAFWIQSGLNAAFDLDMTVEEADAIAGRPLGAPKTAIFGLIDLIGIDLLSPLQASLTSTLARDDPYQSIVRIHPVIEKMIAEGYTGRKGKGGFYRINREAGKRKETLNLATGEYRATEKPQTSSATDVDLGALLTAPGKAGQFAWAVLGPTLAYALRLVPDAADDIIAVDDAMKLGYNWKWGPFELIDRIGSATFSQMLEDRGLEVPPLLRTAGKNSFYQLRETGKSYLGWDGHYQARDPRAGILDFQEIKRKTRPLLDNGSAALWNIGDDVTALEFTGKMNALDLDAMSLIMEAIPVISRDYRALVIYNEGPHFSAGVNLADALAALKEGAFSDIDAMLVAGQNAFKALKYAPFPVVAAPFGMTLGGGCEVVLNSDAVQAHAETFMGLVETSVGLIPGWGGCGEMIERIRDLPGLANGPMPVLSRVFETIAAATVSRSAAHAREIGYLRPTDGITMNRDRLLADAKAKALALSEAYQPPARPSFHLAGPSGRTTLNLAARALHARGAILDYDLVVADALAEVLSGGEHDILDTLTESDLLDLERSSFLALVRDPRTLERISHMLSTGKPLRN